MSLFWREERREVTFQDVWGAGGDLSPGGSETLPALFAAHRTIVDTVASTPLHAFRETPSGAGRRMDRDPALLRPLHGTAYTWKAQAVASMVADGNAFGLSTGLAAGFPTGVVWLRPEQVHIDEEGILPVYFVDGRQVDRRRIVHIPWILQPGKWRGISPLKAFKTTFELGALAQEWGRDWFENDTVPPVHVKNSQRTLTDVEAQSAKTKYRSAVRGRQPFVSGSDWDLNVIGVPADEQRFIASLKLSAGQVATIYGLEPEDCGGEAANSLTYATTEGNERKRAQRIGRPWCMRIEEALTAHMPRPQYAKFNLDAGVRADLKSRMESHEIAMRTGVSTQDEARALEEKEPLTPEQKAEWLAMYGPQSRSPQPAAMREQQ